MRAIITVGVSASGKSTWAKQESLMYGSLITNRDDLRFTMTGHNDWRTYRFNKDIETIVTEMQHAAFLTAARFGKDIIVADTNPKFRQQLIEKLEGMGFEVVLKVFTISYEDAIQRDANRPRPVGAAVISDQLRKFAEQGFTEQ